MYIFEWEIVSCICGKLVKVYVDLVMVSVGVIRERGCGEVLYEMFLIFRNLIVGIYYFY